MAMLLWPSATVTAILSGEDPAPSLEQAARMSPADEKLWHDRIPFARALVWASTVRGSGTAEGQMVKPYLDQLRKEYPRATAQADMNRQIRLHDVNKSTPWDRICDNSYKYDK